MCKGTSYGGGTIMWRHTFHPSIQHLYKRDSFCVDDCIAEEMQYLLSNGLATKGLSCCGHGRIQALAYIFEESILRAIELGYVVKDFYLMDGEVIKGVHLKTGTQIEERAQ